MSLLLATLLSGLFLIALGVALVVSNSAIISTFKALPRSQVGAGLFFGGGALWFVTIMAHISPADLIFVETPMPLAVGFAVLSLAAFWFVPDFLAVRGLSVLTLICGWQLLKPAYMVAYDKPQRLFMVTAVYLAIALAIYLGAVPYRLRDFFQWLFAVPGRARILGGSLLVYGGILAAVAFTY